MAFLMKAEGEVGQVLEWSFPSDDDSLYRVSELVGGYIENILHSKYYSAPYSAFMNEEGRLLDLRENHAAWALLRQLEFAVDDFCPCGDVLLLGPDFKPIPAADLNAISERYKKIVS